jgi:hypothetical protein
MTDKPKTRGRAATTRTARTRVAGAATTRPRGEEASTPAKKGARARGTERASSVIRKRKVKAQDAVAEAQVVDAPAEEPSVASPPDSQSPMRPPELQASETEDNVAGQDKAAAETPFEETEAAPTKTNDGVSEADTDTDSQGAGSAAADASTEAASEFPRTKPGARRTRKSSAAGSGPAAETGAAPKARAAKTRMSKANPVTGKRAGARAAEALDEPGKAPRRRGRAARNQVVPTEEAPAAVKARQSPRKPAARNVAGSGDPVIDQQPRRKALRKDERKPRQTPGSTAAPANTVADIPTSALVVAAAKPKADRAQVGRAEATDSGAAAPDRIMRETMEIAQIGFAANAEMMQALFAARTPAELLEVQVRGMQIMADVWRRQAARIQELYVKTIRGGHRS